MPQTIITCTLIVAIVLYYAISKHIEYARLNNLTSLIAWCVTEDSRIHRCNLDLIRYVQNAQNQYVTNEAVKVTSDNEIEIAKELLKAFQADTIQDFFRDPNLFEIPKSKQSITEEMYFMFLLLFYLNEHKDKTEFIKHEMYNNDNTLTEFGIVFHKLLYISWMFFKNSDMTTKKLIWWPTIEAIPEQMRIS